MLERVETFFLIVGFVSVTAFLILVAVLFGFSAGLYFSIFEESNHKAPADDSNQLSGDSVAYVQTTTLAPTKATSTSLKKPATSTLQTTSTDVAKTTVKKASTTAEPTTTTEEGEVKCYSNGDCPPQIYRRCVENTVYLYNTTFRCRNAGTPDSYCFGKSRSYPIKRCDDYEDCVEGVCERLYLNECDYECNQRDFSGYYCASECNEKDPRVDIGEKCAQSGPICCCIV